MLIKRRFIVIVVVVVFVFASYYVFVQQRNDQVNNKEKIVFPPDYKVLINKTFYLSTPSYDKCGQVYSENLTKFYVGDHVNFTNYCLEYNSSYCSFIYIKSMANKNTLECCNCKVISISGRENMGGGFIYCKGSKYKISSRGEWEIEIQTNYKASLKVLLCTYAGDKSFNPHHPQTTN